MLEKAKPRNGFR